MQHASTCSQFGDGEATCDDVTNEVNVGIHIALPEGAYGHIWDLSGLAVKGAKTSGGVIDADYRGDINVMLRYNVPEPLQYNVGQAIAQLIVLPYSSVTPTPAAQLDDRSRSERLR